MGQVIPTFLPCPLMLEDPDDGLLSNNTSAAYMLGCWDTVKMLCLCIYV